MVRFLAILYGQVLNSCRAVILMTAFQHPHPCFLEQVFGDGTFCRQAHKVTQQSMLVLLDKTVHQVRVSPAKATSDSAGLRLHSLHEVAGGRVLLTGIRVST